MRNPAARHAGGGWLGLGLACAWGVEGRGCGFSGTDAEKKLVMLIFGDVVSGKWLLLPSFLAPLQEEGTHPVLTQLLLP